MDRKTHVAIVQSGRLGSNASVVIEFQRMVGFTSSAWREHSGDLVRHVRLVAKPCAIASLEVAQFGSYRARTQ